MKTRLLILLLATLACQACTKDTPELKSPCVGTDDSPCGPKHSVNAWWMTS